MYLQKFLLVWSLVLVVATALLATLSPIESASAQAFDPSEAEQAQVVRWQAMAEFYQANNMLNVRFDYEEAAAIQAQRWQAMAEFYQAHGLLNAPFDYDEAAVVQESGRQAATAGDQTQSKLDKNNVVADAFAR